MLALTLICFVVCCVAGYIGCNTDVMSIVDASCSGRQRCEFDVLSNLVEQDNLTPCPEGLNMYLEAGYTCAQGMK